MPGLAVEGMLAFGAKDGSVTVSGTVKKAEISTLTGLCLLLLLRLRLGLGASVLSDQDETS